ncbi:hypothetical protein GCM10023189_42670 [Nibrella saemangeumensis]|uniref:Helix-turn-helix domain-containing protein n=1 Tax=Nibrella saemangeumensis TaxID=1084526 RepID=A0ABP8NDX9_9BACT
MTPDDHLLEKCRRLIEEKLGWGNSEVWTNRDFCELSETIFEQTQINLSPTTLKRIWGRVKYESLPNLTTLDTLARFLGHENWRTFRQSYSNGPEQRQATIRPIDEPAAASTDDMPPRPLEKYGRIPVGRWVVWGSAVLVGCAAWMGLNTFSRTKPTTKAPAGSSFAFSSRPVTRGIPNSVLFTYDATASPTDSVYIQQSWDKKRRFRVNKAQHTYTSIYYQPGFFRAKLVVGDSVVQEHNLLIPSDGWVTTVNREPVPVYFSQEESIRNGVLSVPVSLLSSRNIPMQPQPLWVSYSNVPPFEGLRSDNFLFETEVRHDYRQGSAVCQQTKITLLLENDVIVVPLCQLGCVSELGLFIAGKVVDGKTADLSGFGSDLSRWTSVRCLAKNRHLQLWVNDRLAYETIIPNLPTRLIGIRYGFEGTGSVNYVKLSHLDGTVVYAETF